MSLLEAALGALADLASIAGSFLSRRFGQDAWPALQRLLREGPPGRHIIAPGGLQLAYRVQTWPLTVPCLRGLTGPAAAQQRLHPDSL